MRLGKGGGGRDVVGEQEVFQTEFVCAPKNPVHLVDDLVRLLRAELPGLGELLMANQEGLPGSLIPRLHPVEDAVVSLVRPLLEGSFPVLFVPEVVGVLLMTVLRI